MKLKQLPDNTSQENNSRSNQVQVTDATPTTRKATNDYSLVFKEKIPPEFRLDSDYSGLDL